MRKAKVRKKEAQHGSVPRLPKEKIKCESKYPHALYLPKRAVCQELDGSGLLDVSKAEVL